MGGGKGGILGLDRDLQPKMKGLPLARKHVPVICHQIPTYGGWVTLGCCLSQHCLKDVKATKTGLGRALQKPAAGQCKQVIPSS